MGLSGYHKRHPNFMCYCDRVLGHCYLLWLKIFAVPFLLLDLNYVYYLLYVFNSLIPSLYKISDSIIIYEIM